MYFTATVKLINGLVDIKDKFTLNVMPYIDIELWDYWNPITLGVVRVDC